MQFLLLTTLVGLIGGRPNSWREGPIVDPGVFVITHIRDCRNGAGYCILGTNCNVDSDFVPDDLGGHCNGLASGFSPQATFVCCRQNPANFEEESKEDSLEAIILEHNIGHETSPAGDSWDTTPPPSTSIVTEIVTELETSTEVVTKIEEVTKVVTSLIEELVTETGAGWQEESTIPEDWISEETIDREEKQTPIPMIDRFDEAVMNTPEELAELADDQWSGLPGAFSPVKSSPPAVLSVEQFPAWGPLETFDEGVPELPDVYEIEIGQTITGSDIPAQPQVDVLKPGLVFDDTESLFQSIVGAGITNVEGESDQYGELDPPSASAFGSIVNVDLDYSMEPVVDIQEVPVNDNLNIKAVVDNFYPSSGILFEPISAGDAIRNPDQTGFENQNNYDYNVEQYQNEDYSESDFYTSADETATTEKTKDSEYDCNLSVIWGLSCSFTFDSPAKEALTLLPALHDPASDRSDKIENQLSSEIEEDFSSQAWVEISPSSSNFTWPELNYISPNQDDDLQIDKNTESPFLPSSQYLPFALPVVQPPTVVSDAEKTDTMEKDMESPTMPVDFEDTKISLPSNFLESEMGEIIVTAIPLQGKEDTLIPFRNSHKNSVLRMSVRDYQPRSEEGSNLGHRHDLSSLSEDHELLKRFLNTLENSTSSKLESEKHKNSSHLKKPFSNIELDTITERGVTKLELNDGSREQDVSEPTTSTEKHNTNIIKVIENNVYYEISSDQDLITEPDSLPTSVTKPSKNNEFLKREKIQCGVKGGRFLKQAYGEAAVDQIINSWVYGKEPRYEPTEARIIGGKVTSTMLYCWVAAITTKDDKFVCTGSLITDDLVVTSASCIDVLFKGGLGNFKVVLGDSNLNQDIQFGVQEHTVMRALVHENYDVNEKVHHHDIGMLILRTPVRQEDSVCFLCLPQSNALPKSNDCTVTGYGEPNFEKGSGLKENMRENNESDGILREADLDVQDNSACEMAMESEDQFNMTGLLCAQGKGNEQACYTAMDGGSPLTCEADGQHYLAGLVTWGSGCGGAKPSSLFTQVTDYVDWLRESYQVVRPEGPTF